MSYNPVSTNVTAAIKAEAATYGALYLAQGVKHVRYSWILWATISAVLTLGLLWRACYLRYPAKTRRLETFLKSRTVCGYKFSTSRLQLALLALYFAYNVCFSLVDIPYNVALRYPSKHAGGLIQTATTLQFIANRTGFLAFASVPAVFHTISRFNIISLCTGVHYHHINLFHVFTGWMVFFLTWVHTLLWTIEMGIHYHMAGGYLATRWRMRYWLGGFFATLFLCFLCIFSIASIRKRTGYEFFRITHNLSSVLFMIGCWVHWPAAFQWIAASLAIYYADRLLRIAGIARLSRKARGCAMLTGKVHTNAHNESVITASLLQPGLRSASVGQHVYLRCVSLSDWEPHPFTIAGFDDQGAMQLVIREREGMTRELSYTLSEEGQVKVLVEGPYGALSPRYLQQSHIVLIAGGTGISFVLSILDSLCRNKPKQMVKLIWYIRHEGMKHENKYSHTDDTSWVSQRLSTMKALLNNFSIDIIMTRESGRKLSTGSIVGENDKDLSTAVSACSIDSRVVYGRGCNSIRQQMSAFVADTQCRQLCILGCGPGTMNEEIATVSADLGDDGINVLFETEAYSIL